MPRCESMCTSSMIYTRLRTLAGENTASSRRARTLSTPLLDAASSSTTSRIDAVVDAAAGGALIAGIAVDRVLAVDRLGQDLGAGGLAGAARADEQVGMGQPSGLDLLFQRLGNMLLTDDVVKRLAAGICGTEPDTLRASPPGAENMKKRDH